MTIFDPGNLGFRLVTNEMPDVSMADILDEFDISDVDTLFSQELAVQRQPKNRGQ